MLCHLSFVFFDLHPRSFTFLTNKFILFGQSLSFSLPDLLLAELGLVKVIFALTIQIVLNKIFLLTHLGHSRHLLVPIVSILIYLLLPFCFFALQEGRALLIQSSLSVFLFAPLEEHLIVILLL